MANIIKEEYWVRAVRDHDVIRSESNIVGLHIEADTMDQFEEAVLEVAPELIVANHLGGDAAVGQPEELLVPPSPVWNYGRQRSLQQGPEAGSSHSSRLGSSGRL